MALSFGFLVFGFLGLMMGVNVLVLLRFAKFPAASCTLAAILWILWAVQFGRAHTAIHAIYAQYPGFTSVGKFLSGYYFSASLRPERFAAGRTRASVALDVVRAFAAAPKEGKQADCSVTSQIGGVATACFRTPDKPSAMAV